MKEINIARTIMNKRKEKGLTQDELAGYIGVSKAAVSKWEIGQSYPDITFLPQLAAFFNISIDELMGYEPQMCKEDIRKLYLRLSCDFSVKPFEEVMEECRKIIKKYFSCFPLLFQMGTLIVNNSMESGDRERSMTAIEEAKELFIRVKMLGRPRQAKSVMQIGIYQHMGALIDALSNYLSLCMDAAEPPFSYVRISCAMHRKSVRHTVLWIRAIYSQQERSGSFAPWSPIKGRYG